MADVSWPGGPVALRWSEPQPEGGGGVSKAVESMTDAAIARQMREIYADLGIEADDDPILAALSKDREGGK
jgi:hypothetical protein